MVKFADVVKTYETPLGLGQGQTFHYRVPLWPFISSLKAAGKNIVRKSETAFF
jgi:hypothetical protein